MKNKADDVSFKELGEMVRDYTYLNRGVLSRQEKMLQLNRKINSEKTRLEKQGYDMHKLEVPFIEGKEL